MYADLWLMTQATHFSSRTAPLVGGGPGWVSERRIRSWWRRVSRCGKGRCGGGSAACCGALDQGMRMVYVGTLDTTPIGIPDGSTLSGISASTFPRIRCGQPTGCVGGPEDRRTPPYRTAVQEDAAGPGRACPTRETRLHIFSPSCRIDRGTIRELRRLGIGRTQYFNDDPFSRIAPAGFHWKFRHACPVRCPFRFPSPQCRTVSKSRGDSRRALPAELRSEKAFHPAAVAARVVSSPTPRSSDIGKMMGGSIISTRSCARASTSY